MEENKAGNIYDPKDIAEAENSLRKEYDSRQKNFQTVRASYDTISNAEKTSIGDVALISAYMKLLDPTSIVREGEFATAANSGGVPSAIMAAYNKALGTGKIDDNVRNQIYSQSKKIFDNAQKGVDKDTAFFTDIANRRGLNVGNIIYKEPEKGTDGGTTATTDLSSMRNFLKTKWPGEAGKIDSLDLAELQSEYKNTLAGYQPTTGAATEPVRTGAW
jgi:hypothetical protein